ncbi:MAG: glycosyltransferase family 2 protein [Rikenellaceae bacterium]|nr:glycosyltransferase family 2 protein [Rikenellaceae bacterium]
MKVTIGVPVYGVERYIEKCARTLFGQTFDDIEYIFVDDCTPDQSVEVLQRTLADHPERKEQVRIVRHDRNRGVSSARNTVLEQATGEYILFVDSDDYLEPDMVRELHDTAVREDADMVVCDFRYIYEDSGRIAHVPFAPDRRMYIRQLLCRQSNVGIWHRLCHRSLYDSLRFVDGLNGVEDYVIIPILAYRARHIVKLDRPLYNYVKYNPSSFTSTINEKYVERVDRAMELLREFFGSIPDAADYTDCFDRMRMVNKAKFLAGSDRKLRKQVAGMYPGVDYRRSGLPLAQQAILALADRKMWTLLDGYLRTGKRIKKLISR